MRYGYYKKGTKPKNTVEFVRDDQENEPDLPDNDEIGTINFWCKMRYWEPREAAALVLGIVPTDLTEQEAASARFTSLETLIARVTSKKQPRPTYLMARLRKVGVSIPDELFDTCWAYNKKYRSKSMTNTELKAALELEKDRVGAVLEFSNGKDKRSLLAIAYVAIRQAYKGKPLLDKAVASGLQDHLIDMQLKMDPRTLDDWLRVINDFGQTNCNGD